MAGKYISILGDSISTYDGISNGTDIANTTVSGYNAYYKSQMDASQTFWGQLIAKYGMNMLVNNSCGGNCLLRDSGSGVTAPAGYKRVEELAANTGPLNGTKPDLIFIFMGTNDFHANLPLGELTEETYDSVISGDGYITPSTFTQAYIITLEKAQKLYPDAQIYIFTLIPNSWGRDDSAYNSRIRQLATHYENVFLVDVAAKSGITKDNCGVYTFDVLHPNKSGMNAIAKVLEEAIWMHN